ncbi:MAG TPA: pseudouridine synthase, partial [Clostridia bacterium]|nr:pseudouridine synthase [Clostridia bacterium]
VTTASDDRGRKTVFDYIHLKERVFPVGRLDYDSEGLLLFTNDGELAAKLTHPSHEIPKTYLVKVEGEMKESELAVLRNGVMMSGGEKAGKCRVKLLDIKNSVSRLEITLFEGKNREIRRMMAAIGREVAFLKRIAIGALRLGGLSRGEYRPLTEAEVAYLKSL